MKGMDRVLPSISHKVWNTYVECPEKMKNPCFSCGEEMTFHDFQMGHIQVLCENGSDSFENLRPICRGCKLRCAKNNLFEWMKSEGYKLSMCLFNGCLKDAECGWFCPEHSGEIEKSENNPTIENLDNMKRKRELKKNIYIYQAMMLEYQNQQLLNKNEEQNHFSKLLDIVSEMGRNDPETEKEYIYKGNKYILKVTTEILVQHILNRIAPSLIGLESFRIGIIEDEVKIGYLRVNVNVNVDDNLLLTRKFYRHNDVLYIIPTKDEVEYILSLGEEGKDGKFSYSVITRSLSPTLKYIVRYFFSGISPLSHIVSFRKFCEKNNLPTDRREFFFIKEGEYLIPVKDIPHDKNIYFFYDDSYIKDFTAHQSAKLAEIINDRTHVLIDCDDFQHHGCHYKSNTIKDMLSTELSRYNTILPRGIKLYEFPSSSNVSNI